jgi:hypothetical protein
VGDGLAAAQAFVGSTGIPHRWSHGVGLATDGGGTRRLRATCRRPPAQTMVYRLTKNTAPPEAA